MTSKLVWLKQQVTAFIKHYLMENNSPPLSENQSQDSPEQTAKPSSSDTSLPTPTPSPPTAMHIFSALFNGLGVGLLLGLLLGLAVSPVVSGVIGTLSSALALLIGLNEKFLNPVKSLRIGSFGLFCVAGILLGIFIRTNNFLSPSLQELKETYTSVGFTQEEALDFIAYQEFGLMDASWTSAENQSQMQTAAESEKSTQAKAESAAEASPAKHPPAQPAGEAAKEEAIDQSAAETASEPEPKEEKAESDARLLANNNQLVQNRRASVLFSSAIDVGQCYMLETADASMPADEIVNTFQMAGDTWGQLALNLQAALPDSILAKALLTLRDSFCESETTGTIGLKNCVTLQAMKNAAASEWSAALAKQGEVWQQLVLQMNQNIPVNHQATLYQTLTNTLCTDNE